MGKSFGYKMPTSFGSQGLGCMSPSPIPIMAMKGCPVIRKWSTVQKRSDSGIIMLTTERSVKDIVIRRSISSKHA